VITYIGPNGNNGEDDRNRMESGCQLKNPSSGSVCTNFPFSQKFSNPTATGYQCDEWPPALAQQLTFEKKSDKNSLRCMPGGENGSLGSKLSNFVNAKGGPYPGRPAGVRSRDDFFRVDFTTNIATIDPSKVEYCLGGNQPKCDNDGAQFGMTSKPTSNGKISAHYDPNGTDNHYRLTNAGLDDLFQCGVSFDRGGDNAYKNIILTDWQNNDVQITRSCFIGTNGGSCTVKGLPNDLKTTRTGTNRSKNLFEYAPGQNSNPNYFTWDSETSGDGRGPWTDPENDPNRKPLRYCKVVGGGGNPETTPCWFPCYKHADGK
jgi:hypothetical protein